MLGTVSLKPQHSQHGRCPPYTSPPFHRREGQGSERGSVCLRERQSQNRDPSGSQKCLLLSKANRSLLTPVQVPWSPSPTFSYTAGPELRGVLRGGMEGFPCTWPAGEVVVPPQVLRPGALPGGVRCRGGQSWRGRGVQDRHLGNKYCSWEEGGGAGARRGLRPEGLAG